MTIMINHSKHNNNNYKNHNNNNKNNNHNSNSNQLLVAVLREAVRDHGEPPADDTLGDGRVGLPGGGLRLSRII